MDPGSKQVVVEARGPAAVDAVVAAPFVAVLGSKGVAVYQVTDDPYSLVSLVGAWQQVAATAISLVQCYGQIYVAVFNARGGAMELFPLTGGPPVVLPDLGDVPEVVAPGVHGIGAGGDAMRAEICTLHPDDDGPTLLVLVKGRPLLVYRAIPGAEFRFRLHRHSQTQLALAPSARRLATPLRVAGAIGVSVQYQSTQGPCALWCLGSRGTVYVHVVGRAGVLGCADVDASCCEEGCVLLRQSEASSMVELAMVDTVASGDGEEQEETPPAYQVACPMPCAVVPLGCTPYMVAIHNGVKIGEGEMGPKVAALVVAQAKESSADDEVKGTADGDDEYGLITAPPVETGRAPFTPKTRSYELRIYSCEDWNASLGTYTFEEDECVMAMEWVQLPGMQIPQLVVGTGFITSEDLTGRGRFLSFRVACMDARAAGAVKVEVTEVLGVSTAKLHKTPVGALAVWGAFLAVASGPKLQFQRWTVGVGFQPVAQVELGVQISTLASIKSFVLVGDVRGRVHLVRWRHNKNAQALEVLSSSARPLTALASGVLLHDRTPGFLVLDHLGCCHLFRYAPQDSVGDEILQAGLPYRLAAASTSCVRVTGQDGSQACILGSAAGGLTQVIPLDPRSFRTFTTLQALIVARVPQVAGLHVRYLRRSTDVGAEGRRALEDGDFARQFCYLTKTLQEAVAERMQMEVAELNELLERIGLT
mmetsp:Transcript_123845/g.284029  ORF Transcript_123845/g.284029 Transcript_123845/m.284029 type:complete len:705 (+) Transcript_123845:2-2116(+)